MSEVLNDLRLWAPQRDAVRMIGDYVKAYGTGATTGSALVQMPTGTGKTGVIALASGVVPSRCVLVLSPRIGLCEQLHREISHRFFARILPDVKPVRTNVLHWKGGLQLPDGKLDDLVIVSTIQKLQRTFSKEIDVHERLAKHVALILVDEGHYEPALEWREAIRRLPAPKVIFTATPFRNDFKLFDIDFAHVYRLSRKDALREKYIRDVEFEQRSATRVSFVADVRRFYESKFDAKTRASADAPRVIIRCDNHNSIRAIAAELRRLKQTFVAIHEQFRERPDLCEYSKVPDARTTPGTFWIHQYKLLEGIDDPRFRVLAILPSEELGSVRMVVQQVGRVVRNPDPSAPPPQPAYVLDYSGGGQHELWKNYLGFEKVVDEEGIAHLDLGRRLIEGLKKALPSLVYVDGKFRAPASLDSIDATLELRIPRTANVHHALDDFDMDVFASEVEREYLDRDEVLHRVILKPDRYVALRAVLESSPLLAYSYFTEVRLSVTVALRQGDWLFLYDTGGLAGVELPGVGLSPSPRQLKRLFRRGSDNRLTGISLRGSNLGTNAIRTRAFTAASVAETMPGFDDRANVCTIVKGVVRESPTRLHSRYLGLVNGRVSDESGERVSLQEYVNWTKEIAAQLRSSVQALPEFSRYALESRVPPDPAPSHILLDLDDFLARFETRSTPKAKAVPVMIEDTAAEVLEQLDKTHRFALTVNGKVCSVWVSFNPETERYHLESDELDRMVVPRADAPRESLRSLLNREQSFRIIPRSTGYFYAAGHFFKPEANFGPSYSDDELQLFKLLEPHAVLERCTSEKGRGRGRAWPANTVFRLLDDLGAGHPVMSGLLAGSTIVVCDDLGTECADFIFVDDAMPRVVLAHAKASDTRKPCSATSLQDVCMQAAKNARYLARYSEEVPPKMKSWHTSPWRVKALGPISRIRKGPPEGTQAWDGVRAAVRDWRTSKEIWLVLGNMLSRQEFERQLKSSPPVQEAIQVALLLFSTAQAANALGARLRVFCIP